MTRPPGPPAPPARHALQPNPAGSPTMGTSRTATSGGGDLHDGWHCTGCAWRFSYRSTADRAREVFWAHYEHNRPETLGETSARHYRAGLTMDDLPPDHPIRQEVAGLTVKLALAEGKVSNALDQLDREAGNWSRHNSAVGQLIEAIGCHLTGRKGAWHPGDR